jgi:hypothetical protein
MAGFGGELQIAFFLGLGQSVRPDGQAAGKRQKAKGKRQKLFVFCSIDNAKKRSCFFLIRLMNIRVN